MRIYIGIMLLWLSFCGMGYTGSLDKPVDNPKIEKLFHVKHWR